MTMGIACPPFTTRVLDPRPDDPPAQQRDLLSLLPATRRTDRDDIIAVELGDEWLGSELLVPRLNNIQNWLWICGRPMPPRPLHHQLLLSRVILITESMGLHLVWSPGRIYIKPMPPYLLDPGFWAAHVVSAAPERDAPDPARQALCGCALGFLFTYAALVAHESDFRIAQDAGLLPAALAWSSWRALCAEIVRGHCYAAVNPRFWYGELRLGRLNMVWRARTLSLWRGYSQVDASVTYADLLRDNFAWLAAILAYVAIVLTAMQVGLATERLSPDHAFQYASYFFTVFSILTPLIGVVAIAAYVVALVVLNLHATKRYEKRRFQGMGVDPAWRASGNTKARVPEVQ